jgi:Spy/CpxP family protein refolding chaperone
MKTLLTALLITLFSFSALAGSHNDNHGDRRMEKMISKLDLTETQSEQVKSILESKKAEREAIHEQMKALREKTNQELSQVLTGEQMDKLASFQEKRRDKKKDKR